MTSHLSERFHDRESREFYLDFVQSSLDRPIGADQAWLFDRIVSPDSRPDGPAAGHTRSHRPRLVLRWMSLPRLPVPFLTWAQT